MDLKVISELIKLVSESKLTSLEVEEKEFRIKLEKNNYKSTNNEAVIDNTAVLAKDKSYVATQSNETLNEDNSFSVEEANVVDKEEDLNIEGLKIVKSPIVGTFYLSSSPESEPFVTKGKKIKKGATLCIIEAMKLMNEIDSEFDCEVIDILVENGAVVEYGQPLFRVK
jgi:acetyl-CoA carboxylase biotin carboxyl carrier protein